MTGRTSRARRRCWRGRRNNSRRNLSVVIAGLVPAVHVLLATKKDVDAHDISAFTRVFDALFAVMTVERPEQINKEACQLSR